jgi:hypothetical protein
LPLFFNSFFIKIPPGIDRGAAIPGGNKEVVTRILKKFERLLGNQEKRPGSDAQILEIPTGYIEFGFKDSSDRDL